MTLDLETIQPSQFPTVPVKEWGVFKIFLRLAITKEYPTIAVIEELEAEMLKLDQQDCPVTHEFSPGIYIRTAIMPVGAFVIGHLHKHEHFNLATKGSAIVWMNGSVHEIKAPFLIKSDAGVKKMFLVKEELTWSTIHATTETDLAKLEDEIFVKSKAFLDFEKGIK